MEKKIIADLEEYLNEYDLVILIDTDGATPITNMLCSSRALENATKREIIISMAGFSMKEERHTFRNVTEKEMCVLLEIYRSKEPIDAQGQKLAKRERAWYEKAESLNISGISMLPEIYNTSPLQMELIKGRNIYECDLSYQDRKKILVSLIEALKQLHAAEHVFADSFSIKEAYFNKTMDRLSTIRDLVPYADREHITVNGRRCRNVYFYKRELEKKLEEIKCDHFSFIHGDCTFSNLMVRDGEDGEPGNPVLIDPRGYFGFTELYGDELYDWAKLYYSIVGNYDRFNLKDFKLDIGGRSLYTDYTKEDDVGLKEGEVSLTIASNHWEDMEEDFLDLTGADRDAIKLIHAVIWLSLTTYAWQDYDSICGAFYNGLYYLEEAL